jgi:c-di-GMP-binding flagellar brake protein YcgR
MTDDDKFQDDSPFRVYSKLEILSLLTGMMKRNQLLSMSIKGGSESAITSILNIDNDDLILDAAPSAEFNDHILHSKRISFEALHNNVRIIFNVDEAHQSVYQGRPALQIKIPGSLLRLQRREYFRIAAPVNKPLRCIFHVNGKTIVTKLNNISTGGISVTDENKLLNLERGHIYEDCLLEMTGNSSVSINLKIRDCHRVELASGKAIHRLGCEFIDVPHATMAKIQRFIIKLEREQNAKTE